MTPVDGGMRHPKKRPVRHAADLAVHLFHAERSASWLTDLAPAQFATRAEKLRDDARRLRKEADQLEEDMS